MPGAGHTVRAALSPAAHVITPLIASFPRRPHGTLTPPAASERCTPRPLPRGFGGPAVSRCRPEYALREPCASHTALECAGARAPLSPPWDLTRVGRHAAFSSCAGNRRRILRGLLGSCAFARTGCRHPAGLPLWPQGTGGRAWNAP